MYRVKIESLETLNVFLSISDFDFIDAILEKDLVSFIVNYAGVFAYISFKCDSSARAGTEYIRIPRKVFNNLVQIGTIIFKIDESKNEVSIDFLDKESTYYCGITFNKQVVQLYSYSDKLELIKNFQPTNHRIDLGELVKVNKINKNVKSDITVYDGYISIDLTNGKLFTKTVCKDNFTLSYYTCSFLLKCSNIGYSVENYVLTKRENLVLLVTKNRRLDTYNYDDFLKEKSKYVCVLDLTSARFFVNKIKCDTSILKIDTINRMCSFEQDNISFKVPIRISNEQSVPGVSITELEIPISVVKEVLNNTNVKEVKLFRKRTFTQLKIEELVVAY